MSLNRSKWDKNKVLYKYSSAEGVVKILDNMTIKCTTPLSFNDPFDTITEIRTDFDPDQFPQAFLDELHRLITQKDEPAFEVESEFSAIIRSLRKIENKREGKPTLESIRHLINPIIDGLKSQTEADNKEWYHFLSTWRIFCLSEVYDNLLMWGHYCDKHKGVVIGFRCVPEIDSAFCVAIPVAYSNKIPSLGSLEEWVYHTIGTKKKASSTEEKFIQMTYTKGTDWQYEKEWRFALPKMEDATGDFDLRGILPDEIHSVYLGCRMDEIYKKRITDLLASKLKHVLLFQATRSKTKFKLNFERMDCDTASV